MPRPPLEADGSVAFNCRCYLTPVLLADPVLVQWQKNELVTVWPKKYATGPLIKSSHSH
jgi:hypothetical protein